MSHDQDPADFASGDFHHVIHDEPPRWRSGGKRGAHHARGGRLYLSMTWPDDPTIPVDWIFDQIYDKGVRARTRPRILTGSSCGPPTTVNLNQDAVRTQMGPMGRNRPRMSAFTASRSGSPTASTRFSPTFRSIGPITAGKVIVPETANARKPAPPTLSNSAMSRISSRHAALADGLYSRSAPAQAAHVHVGADDGPMMTFRCDRGRRNGRRPADLRDYIFRTERRIACKSPTGSWTRTWARPRSSQAREITWQDEFDNARPEFALGRRFRCGPGASTNISRPDKRPCGREC
jgi:hypothetical protein